MATDITCSDLSELIERHQELVVQLAYQRRTLKRLRLPPARLKELEKEEATMRLMIVAWKPAHRVEAYDKILHLARVVTVGIVHDRATLQAIIESVSSYLLT